MRPVDEHLEACLAAVTRMRARSVPLLEARGCVLTHDVHSPVALPPFANSAMDGYAVVMSDVASADDTRPVDLPVSADVPAGPSTPITLAPGSVVRVMTGAPVPTGTEAVVPVEWTDAGTDRVLISQAPQPGQYLRSAGEDVEVGELVLRAGVRLTSRHLGLAAAVGRRELVVRPVPRVVVLSTGSELVPPGGQLGFGQIYDSNGYALTAAAIEAGASARYAGFVGDDEDDVLAALEAACLDADLVITSGGVSAGAYDPVKAALRAIGRAWFGPVAMQPGMPQGLGSFGDQDVPVLTLPGNPVSSMVSFEVFARPMVLAMLGASGLRRPTVRARAESGWKAPAGKRQYARAVVSRSADGAVVGGDGVGAFTVRPVGAQGSHLVADLAEANALAMVPETVTRVEPGDELECLLLEGSSGLLEVTR